MQHERKLIFGYGDLRLHKDTGIDFTIAIGDTERSIGREELSRLAVVILSHADRKLPPKPTPESLRAKLSSAVEVIERDLASAYDALYDVEDLLGQTGHRPEPKSEDLFDWL